MMMMMSCRVVQATVSALVVTTQKQPEFDVDTGHYQQQLRSLACNNDGVVVHWPAEPLTAVVDRHKAEQRPLTGVTDVRWTLPYVSAATTSTTRQTQPVISVSLPVYSNHSHRSSLPTTFMFSSSLFIITCKNLPVYNTV